MREIKFFSARQFNAKLKVTIQSTGKLGFTGDTAKELKLNSQTYIKLGADTSDSNSMYMVVLDEANEDAFKVCKAGDYYYLSTSVLFMALGYDFKNKTIIFDLSRSVELDNTLGGVVYKLNKRENEKKKK